MLLLPFDGRENWGLKGLDNWLRFYRKEVAQQGFEPKQLAPEPILLTTYTVKASLGYFGKLCS